PLRTLKEIQTGALSARQSGQAVRRQTQHRHRQFSTQTSAQTIHCYRRLKSLTALPERVARNRTDIHQSSSQVAVHWPGLVEPFQGSRPYLRFVTQGTPAKPENPGLAGLTPSAYKPTTPAERMYPSNRADVINVLFRAALPVEYPLCARSRVA